MPGGGQGEIPHLGNLKIQRSSMELGSSDAPRVWKSEGKDV